MFGTKKRSTPSELVNEALRRIEEKYEDNPKDLFDGTHGQGPKGALDKNGSEQSDDSSEQGGYPGRTSSEDAEENQVEEPKGKFEGTTKQLDLFEYQANELPKVKIPGRLRTKQTVSTTLTGKLDISDAGFVIQSPQGAATLLSHLVLESQEQAYFISLDKDGKVLENHSQI